MPVTVVHLRSDRTPEGVASATGRRRRVRPSLSAADAVQPHAQTAAVAAASDAVPANPRANLATVASIILATVASAAAAATGDTDVRQGKPTAVVVAGFSRDVERLSADDGRQRRRSRVESVVDRRYFGSSDRSRRRRFVERHSAQQKPENCQL